MTDPNAVREHVRHQIAKLTEVLEMKRAENRTQTRTHGPAHQRMSFVSSRLQDDPEPTALPATATKELS